MKKKIALLGGLLVLMAIVSLGESFPVAAGAAQTVESTVPKTANVVNINTAGVNQLSSIPGLGEKKSQEIVKFREKNGNFSRIEDIKKVQGIGDKLFEKIKRYLTVKGDAAPKTANQPQ
jgi:competence protein ComEA